MSVRLWWKFSPYLITPLPMMATLPPSPMEASSGTGLSLPFRPERPQAWRAPEPHRAAGEDQRAGSSQDGVRPEGGDRDAAGGQHGEQRVVDHVRGHRRQRAAGALGDEPQPEAEAEREHGVEPFEMEQAEGEARDQHGDGRWPLLGQTRLHVAAEEDLLGHPRDDTDDQRRREEIEARGALQRAEIGRAHV